MNIINILTTYIPVHTHTCSHTHTHHIYTHTPIHTHNSCTQDPIDNSIYVNM